MYVCPFITFSKETIPLHLVFVTGKVMMLSQISEVLGAHKDHQDVPVLKSIDRDVRRWCPWQRFLV